MPTNITLICEDGLSGRVATKILRRSSQPFQVHRAFHWNKQKIIKKAAGINKAARGSAFFIFTDQDTLDRCPPAAIRELKAPLHGNLIYRFAVMETEAWLLAHREAVADFLRISQKTIPEEPERIERPKEFLVNLARRSKNGGIRRDIVPGKNLTAKVGRYYNGRLAEFVRERWEPNIAARRSQSLRRALDRIDNFTFVPQ